MDTLINKLHDILPAERIKARLIDRYAYASDASHYYLVPKAVIQPISIEEIQGVFEFSHREKINLTFRAGGTSLSGQGVTDGILVDLSNYWRKVTVENEGNTVRVEPAAIGAHVNIALKRYGRKIGPDPASINAAMMGGILSNNSSGMCRGVAQNSYHTVKHMTFVLPNGKVYNTGLPEDYSRFETESAGIAQELLALKKEIQNNPVLVERIRKKYRQKNTVGYCMNAFLDFEHPLDILTHVIIGSEGTLAFIAEGILHTVPDLPYKITGILYFVSPETACNAIADLKSTGAAALEFMDRASLRSVEEMPGVPPFLKDLPPRAAAILSEFQQTSQEALIAQYTQAQVLLFAGVPLKVDEWNIDAIYTGTQKCLSAPPGLSPVSFSENAVKAPENRKTKVQSWFLDLSMVKNYWSGAKRAYHHTAPVSSIFALNEALNLVLEEGLEERWKRHTRVHLYLKSKLEKLGFSFLVDEAYRLPNLNSVFLPEGLDEATLRNDLLNKYNIEVGGGLGAFAGKIWRIGIMGESCTEGHVDLLIGALDELL